MLFKGLGLRVKCVFMRLHGIVQDINAERAVFAEAVIGAVSAASSRTHASAKAGPGATKRRAFSSI